MNDETVSLDSEIKELIKQHEKEKGSGYIVIIKLDGKKIEVIPPVTIEITVEPVVKVEQPVTTPVPAPVITASVITTTTPIVENKKFDVNNPEYRDTMEFLNRCIEAYPTDKFVASIKNYFEKWGKITEPQKTALIGSLNKYNNRKKKDETKK
jgi:hypothetical protein